MMRRGLWQQKQRQPSACLLCRFSYRHGPYARTAPFPPSKYYNHKVIGDKLRNELSETGWVTTVAGLE
ncbi:hypothetical protein VTH06DRAFT_5457 [Thermothelomyces fergusii]